MKLSSYDFVSSIDTVTNIINTTLNKINSNLEGKEDSLLRINHDIRDAVDTIIDQWGTIIYRAVEIERIIIEKDNILKELSIENVDLYYKSSVYKVVTFENFNYSLDPPKSVLTLFENNKDLKKLALIEYDIEIDNKLKEINDAVFEINNSLNRFKEELDKYRKSQM